MEYGLVMVLFLAAIQRISPDLFDAAKVDGAGVVSEVRHVTIPALRYEILVAVVVTVGGPAAATGPAIASDASAQSAVATQ